jgi:hypothetical protein
VLWWFHPSLFYPPPMAGTRMEAPPTSPMLRVSVRLRKALGKFAPGDRLCHCKDGRTLGRLFNLGTWKIRWNRQQDAEWWSFPKDCQGFL